MSIPKIIVALDYQHADDALRFVDKVSPQHCCLKVGKELFTAEGPSLVRQLVKRNFRIFLDLKFHDIPNTVARAVSAAAGLGVWMVNVHASGGPAMMRAARQALDTCGKDRPLLTAVTVLTSMSEQDLRIVGVQRSLPEQVSALAALAQDCGMDGVVCSAQEAPVLRQQGGKAFVLVTPGIRPAAVSQDDQSRVVTPAEAVHLGSDYLVIGRPVTQAENPSQALLTIIDDISYKHS